MKNQVTKLIAYDHWANQKILHTMASAPSIPSRAIELLSHILAVSSIWLCRVKGESETSKRFDLYSLDECRAINDRQLSAWLECINAEPEIDIKTVSFSLVGQSCEISVLDCVHHTVMHGSYHRGQIVALLKESMVQLPMTDFVLFVNEKL